jgi:hypothetical protein
LIADFGVLAADIFVPPIDPAHEQRLLAAFDAHWQAPPRRSVRWPLAAAGLLATAATVVWAVAIRDRRADLPVAPPRAVAGIAKPAPPVANVTPDVPVSPPTPARGRRPRSVRPPAAETTFVMWPGARDLPRFESGQLMRVELPASVASSLGLRPPQPSAFVQTDVLVGQDGYARAVRLVQ